MPIHPGMILIFSNARMMLLIHLGYLTCHVTENTVWIPNEEGRTQAILCLKESKQWVDEAGLSFSEGFG